MTAPSHSASAMFHRTICQTEQQMCQKGFVVNNNLRRMYSDFPVFCVLNSIFVFVFFFRCKASKYATVTGADKVKVKIVFGFLTFESDRCQYSIPGHILTHGITKGWLCIDADILSIWLNQHPADYEAQSGGKSRRRLFFHFISSIVARTTSCHCKQRENI